MSFLQLQNVDFSYPEENQILCRFNLTLKEGEAHCILGPSGSGKSTLLHIIAGLLIPQGGRILLGGRILNEGPFSLPPESRDMGLLFQEHCLFPHLTIEGNLHFALKNKTFEEGAQTLLQTLELVGLGHKKKAYPENLSGGEQKRAALARALVRSPKLLLLDEPFSSLDPLGKIRLRSQIKQLLNSLKLTAIIVTHSLREAFEFGDRVTFLGPHQKYQTGSADDLFFHPQSSGPVQFMGSGILIEGHYHKELESVVTEHGPFKIANPFDFKNLQEAFLFVPSSHLSFEEGEGPLLGKAKIISEYSYGEKIYYTLEGQRGIRPSCFEVERPRKKGSGRFKFQRNHRLTSLILKRETPPLMALSFSRLL